MDLKRLCPVVNVRYFPFLSPSSRVAAPAALSPRLPGSDADRHRGHRAGARLPGPGVGHSQGAARNAHGGLGQLVVLRPLVELGLKLPWMHFLYFLSPSFQPQQVGAAVQHEAPAVLTPRQRRRVAPLARAGQQLSTVSTSTRSPRGPSWLHAHHEHALAQRHRAVPAARRAQRRPLLPRRAPGRREAHTERGRRRRCSHPSPTRGPRPPRWRGSSRATSRSALGSHWLAEGT